MEKFNKLCVKWYVVTQGKLRQGLARLRDESGQGTTEYAILVGVLVVIAIGAISLFKPKLEELWNGIVAGMESL